MTNSRVLTPSAIIVDHRLMRALVALSITVLAACTKPVPGICCTSPDDCTSIGVSEPERPCDMGLVCVDHQCSAAGCQVDMDCAAPTPFCAPDHSCVGCLQSDQCPASTPTCDSTTHVCRACASDDDCDSGVCDDNTGMCLAEADILYASPTGAATASCGKTDMCSIERAFALAATPRDTVKLAAGNYSTSISITDKVVKVDGFGASVSRLASGPAFEVVGASRLVLLGLTVTDSLSDNVALIDCHQGAAASNANLEIDRAVINGNNTAIQGVGCRLTMTLSTVRASPTGLAALAGNAGRPAVSTIDRCLFDGGGGVVWDGAQFTNSVFVNQNGHGGAFGFNVLMSNTPYAMSVSFSTVINSMVNCNQVGGQSCRSGVGAAVCIDDSVIFNGSASAPADTLTGTTCSLTYTAIFPQSTSVPGTNNMLGVDPKLAAPAAGDYHLQLGSPAIDAADPATTPTPDFDGTPRPQGTRSDIGAFEFKP